MKVTVLKWFVYKATLVSSQLKEFTVIFTCIDDETKQQLWLPCTIVDCDVAIPKKVALAWAVECQNKYAWTTASTECCSRLCSVVFFILKDRFMSRDGDFPLLFKKGVDVCLTQSNEIYCFQNVYGDENYQPTSRHINVSFKDTTFIPNVDDILLKAVSYPDKILGPGQALLECLRSAKPEHCVLTGADIVKAKEPDLYSFRDADIIIIDGMDTVCEGCVAALHFFKTRMGWTFSFFDIQSSMFLNSPYFIMYKDGKKLDEIVQQSNILFTFSCEDPSMAMNFVRSWMTCCVKDDHDNNEIIECNPDMYASQTAKKACIKGGTSGIVYHNKELTVLENVRVYAYDFSSYMPSILIQLDSYPWKRQVQTLIRKRTYADAVVKNILVKSCGYIAYSCPKARKDLVMRSRDIMCRCIDYVEGLSKGNTVLDVMTDGFTVLLNQHSPEPKLEMLKKISGGITARCEGKFTDLISSSVNKKIFFNRHTDDIKLIGCKLHADPVAVKRGTEACARAIFHHKCWGRCDDEKYFSWLRDTSDLCSDKDPPGYESLLDICSKHKQDVASMWRYTKPYPIIRVAALSYPAHQPFVSKSLRCGNAAIQQLVSLHSKDRTVLYDSQKTFAPDLFYYSGLCLNHDHLAFVCKVCPASYKAVATALREHTASLLLEYTYHVLYTESHYQFINDPEVLKNRLQQRHDDCGASSISGTACTV